MIGCVKCGTLNRKGSKYCSYCGERLNEGQVVCPSCGRPNTPENAYCIYCSAPLQSPASAREEMDDSVDAPTTDSQPQPPKKVQLPAWLYTTPETESTPALTPTLSVSPVAPTEQERTKYLAEIEGILPSADQWLELSDKRASDPNSSAQSPPEETPQRVKTARRSGCLVLALPVLLALIGLITIR